MLDDLVNHFEQILKPLFQKDSELCRLQTSSDVIFSVSWKLNNDPSRPNKRSKRILLVIPQECVADYREGNQQERSTREARMTYLVKEQLKLFIPDHNTSYGQPAPEEKWVLI